MKIEYPLNFIRANDLNETSLYVKGFLEDLKFVLIVGKTHSKDIANKILKYVDLKPYRILEIDLEDHENIATISEELKINDIDIVLSVGGGVAIDYAKRLALLVNKRFIAVPTIVSNDGMASPISVLKIGGKKVSLPGKLPDTIIVPIDVLKEAPLKYIKSALLDTLSNLSAVNDWRYADEGLYQNQSSSMAVNLSNMAASMVLNIKNLELADNRILECALDVQLLSGMAMTICGSSRPCSGSEHIISHALDNKEMKVEILHGEKVGTISEFCLFIQDSPQPAATKLLRKLNIKKGIPGIKDLSKEKTVEFFSLAKRLRPERKTILEKYSAESLYELHCEFIKS
tara:strand:- start:25318 stop:26349 length:1032 start_codon:yes stop_codon:yes gene_type:complete